MACFKCEQCGHEELVPNVSGHLEEPKRCGAEACRAAWSLKMVHNRSLYVNKQIVKMQVRVPPSLHYVLPATANFCGRCPPCPSRAHAPLAQPQ